MGPPMMSVPTYYVCPHLFCLSPPIIFFADKSFLNLDRLGNVRVCLECFWRVFGLGLKGSMVSLILRKCHFQKCFEIHFLPHLAPSWQLTENLASSSLFPERIIHPPIRPYR